MDRPLAVIDNFVGIVGTVLLLLGLAQSANADTDKRPTSFGLVVSQPLVVGLKRLPRARDRLMNFGTVMFVPPSEIFGPIEAKAGDDSGPDESGARIRAVLSVG